MRAVRPWAGGTPWRKQFPLKLTILERPGAFLPWPELIVPSKGYYAEGVARQSPGSRQRTLGSL
jgi:hypothetical protein